MSRVYVGNLGSNGSRRELERAFEPFGPLRDVWVARNPPGFAFVLFEDSRDAEDACHDMDGKYICGEKIRVEMARGPSRGGRATRIGFTEKCYECGRVGHYARACTRIGRPGSSRDSRDGGRDRGDRRRRSRSRSPRSRSRSPKRRRTHSKSQSPRKRSQSNEDKKSRSRSKSHSKSKSRSRSRSQSKEKSHKERKHSQSNEDKKSRSRSKSHSKSKSRSRSRSQSKEKSHKERSASPDKSQDKEKEKYKDAEETTKQEETDKLGVDEVEQKSRSVSPAPNDDDNHSNDDNAE